MSAQTRKRLILAGRLAAVAILSSAAFTSLIGPWEARYPAIGAAVALLEVLFQTKGSSASTPAAAATTTGAEGGTTAP